MRGVHRRRPSSVRGSPRPPGRRHRGPQACTVGVGRGQPGHGPRPGAVPPGDPAGTSHVKLSEIVEPTGLSKSYASQVRAGKFTRRMSRCGAPRRAGRSNAASTVRSMTERSPMAEYPSLVVVFLRALTTASPRRWPRSAPSGARRRPRPRGPARKRIEDEHRPAH